MGASQVYQDMRAAGIRPDVCTFIHLFEVRSQGVIGCDVVSRLHDCHATGTGRRACRSVPVMPQFCMCGVACA